MRFEKKVEDKYTLIKVLEEKLDSQVSPSLKSEFTLLSASGVKNVLLHMGAVKYADSSGLSAILTANRFCRSAGGALVLCCLQDHVQKLISISHLDSVLTILPTEEEARDEIYMSEIQSEIEESE